MPGLNFKPEYAPKILDGSKPFTLRKRRRDGREAALGARLMLFTGMRTKDCRQFATTTVVARATVAFRETGLVGVFHAALHDAPERCADIIRTLEAAARYPNGPETPARLQQIAEWDGFASWADMWAFHKGQGLDMDGNAVREFFGFGAIVPVGGDA